LALLKRFISLPSLSPKVGRKKQLKKQFDVVLEDIPPSSGTGAIPGISASHLFCEGWPTSRKPSVKGESGVLKFFDKDGERHEERY